MFVENFRILNRKERFWLLHKTLGASKFSELDRNFLSEIDRELGLSAPMPHNAWWAMDYHFDWICAALWMTKGNYLARRGDEF
ncbi:hypothetical protein [Polycladidibacter stylochi]|uniref:hypothetical protein n=1 Tax=Polycladidibacter stylochi TaxID=1807766 RepID=UPI0008298F59|nr:hypothetical protein [Pseudovibrio stylochi]